MLKRLKSFTMRDAIIVLILAAAVGYGSHKTMEYAFSDLRIPVVIQKVEALTPVIKSGTFVIARIWRTKARGDCPIETAARLVRPDGSAWYPDNPGKSITSFVIDSVKKQGEVDKDFVDVGYNVQTAPIGAWVLKQRLTYRCPDKIFVIEQPPFAFEIIARG